MPPLSQHMGQMRNRLLTPHGCMEVTHTTVFTICVGGTIGIFVCRLLAWPELWHSFSFTLFLYGAQSPTPLV